MYIMYTYIKVETYGLICKYLCACDVMLDLRVHAGWHWQQYLGNSATAPLSPDLCLCRYLYSNQITTLPERVFQGLRPLLVLWVVCCSCALCFTCCICDHKTTMQVHTSCKSVYMNAITKCRHCSACPHAMWTLIHFMTVVGNCCVHVCIYMCQYLCTCTCDTNHHLESFPLTLCMYLCMLVHMCAHTWP